MIATKWPNFNEFLLLTDHGLDNCKKLILYSIHDIHFQMLGDIFLRFTTQLRAYTNFLNNYPVTLQTLERVRRFNK